MKRLPDEELIARCAGGDRRAMDILVSRYHGKLLDFALRQLRDRDAAADVAQKALLRAFEAAGTYRDKASFKTWLYTIALNLVREEFRRRGTRKESLLGDLDAESEWEQTAVSPEDKALERIESEALWDAVEGLREEHRTAVILRFRYGFTNEEIAEVMGAPGGTVRSWIHYALKSLRKSLRHETCGS